MTGTGSYASFLVRLWRDATGEEAADGAPWQAELESIQSGESWRFGDVAALVAFLEARFQEAEQDSGK